MALSLLVGLGVVLAAGAPLVTLVVHRQLHRRDFVDTYNPDKRTRIEFDGNRIQPIDLGPDLISWPSESGRQTPYVEKLQWPSAHWDDDAFGRKAASAAGENARRQAEQTRATNVAARRKATAPKHAEDRSTEQAPVAPDPVEHTAPTVRLRPRPAPTPPERPARPDPLSEDAIRDLIRARGLGNAVKHLQDSEGLSLDDVKALLLRARR